VDVTASFPTGSTARTFSLPNRGRIAGIDFFDDEEIVMILRIEGGDSGAGMQFRHSTDRTFEIDNRMFAPRMIDTLYLATIQLLDLRMLEDNVPNGETQIEVSRLRSLGDE
jgi:hypothetical protein